MNSWKKRNGSEKLTTEQRFLEKFKTENEDSCWIWEGAKSKKGYGVLRSEGKNVLAHRYSYEYFIGNIPTDFLVCHSCDNPSCVNPKHLFIGSSLDNMQDMVKKSREDHTKNCRGENHTWSKLTKDQVMDIKREYSSGGVNQVNLAIKYKVTEGAIWRIVHGINWKS